MNLLKIIFEYKLKFHSNTNVRTLEFQVSFFVDKSHFK